MTDYKKYEPFFGTWYITRKIGAGSFGEVFEIAKQDRMLGKPSALKIIQIPHNPEDAKIRLAEGTTPEALSEYYDSVLKELEHEISIMSDLKGHSNIVSLEDYDVKPHEDGIGYDLLIKMELLQPFQQKMTKMSMKDVVQLGIDMCTALDACHQKKIIHRDIKPSNIFISDAGNYKLGDFGIARTMANADTILSRKGTFNYMAPEIYIGNREYDMTVDIYSLGLVMYSLLNGNRLPFAPPTSEKYTVKSEQAALARRMRGEAFPQLNVPKRLDAIIRKACAYRPENRFSSALLMKRELEEFRASCFTDMIINNDAEESPLDVTEILDTPDGDATLPLEQSTESIDYSVDADATEILPNQSYGQKQRIPEPKPQVQPVPAAAESKRRSPSRKAIIIIACAVAICAIGAVLGALFLMGGAETKLISTATHTDPAEGDYQTAVILQVQNEKDGDPITGALVNVTTEDGDETFSAYGLIPGGEEGLLAGVWKSEDKPTGNEKFIIDDNSYYRNAGAPAEFEQITADILGTGKNVTMETDHNDKGYATDWNDNDFAKYEIMINNNSDVSLSEGEALGIAVVYEGGKLKQGDIIYNQLGAVGAHSQVSGSAVFPKYLGKNKDVKVFILPSDGEVY